MNGMTSSKRRHRGADRGEQERGCRPELQVGHPDDDGLHLPHARPSG